MLFTLVARVASVPRSADARPIVRKLNVWSHYLLSLMTNRNTMIQVTETSQLALDARRMAGSVLTLPRGASQVHRKVPGQNDSRTHRPIPLAVRERWLSIFQVADMVDQVKTWL